MTSNTVSTFRACSQYRRPTNGAPWWDGRSPLDHLCDDVPAAADSCRRVVRRIGRSALLRVPVHGAEDTPAIGAGDLFMVDHARLRHARQRERFAGYDRW